MQKIVRIYGHKLKRIGYTKTKRAVYYLEGKGYWICPPYISMSACATTTGHPVVITFSPYQQPTVSLMARGDRKDILDKLSKVVRMVADAGYLFDLPVQRCYFKLPYTIPKSNLISFMQPQSDGSRKTIGVQLRKGERPLDFVERARERKKELIAEFRKEHTITVEDALTFHNVNPLLYELSDEIGNNESKRKAVKSTAGNAYRKAKLGL